MSRLYVFLVAGALSGCVVTQDWERFQFGDADAGPGQQQDGGAADAGPDAGPDGGLDAGMDAGCVPAPETCDGTDQDCDGRIDEHPTECSFPNATTACEAGECVMDECEDGFADCDEAAPGCETDLRADRDNCGACGVSCGSAEVCTASACAEPGEVLDVVKGGAYLNRLAASTERIFLGGSFGERAILESDTYTAIGSSDGLLLGADVRLGTNDRIPHLWGVQVGGSDGTVHLHAVASDGLNVSTIGGQYWNPVAPSGAAAWPTEGWDEGFVVSVDQNGAIRWTHLYISAEDDQVQDVAVDSAGAVYVVASTTSSSLRIQDRFGLYPTVVDPAECMVLAKHRVTNGTVDWARTFNWCGGSRWLTTGPEGRTVVFGTLLARWSPAVIGDDTLTAVDSFNPMLASFDSQGEPEWARLWRCSRGSGNVRGAVFGPDGDLFVAIECGGETDLGSGPVDAEPGLLMRLDRSGELVWSRPINRAGASQPRRLAFGPEGRLYVIGELVGDADFGRGTITAASSTARQHFVASFDLDGENRWGLLFGGHGNSTAHDVTVERSGSVLTSFAFTDSVMVGGRTYAPSLPPPFGDDRPAPPATMVVRITEP